MDQWTRLRFGFNRATAKASSVRVNLNEDLGVFLPKVLFLSEHSLSCQRNCSSYNPTTSLKNLRGTKTQHLLHLTKGCHWIQSRQQLHFVQDQLAPRDTSWTSKIFFKIVLWMCFTPADILGMERHYTNIQPGVISFDHLDNGRPNPDCRQTLVWRICRLNPSTLSGLGTYVSLSPIVSNIYTALDEPAFSPNWRLPISRERRVHGILLIFFDWHDIEFPKVWTLVAHWEAGKCLTLCSESLSHLSDVKINPKFITICLFHCDLSTIYIYTCYIHN